MSYKNGLLYSKYSNYCLRCTEHASKLCNEPHALGLCRYGFLQHENEGCCYKVMILLPYERLSNELRSST